MQRSMTILLVVCTLLSCGACIANAQGEQAAASAQAMKTKVNPKDGAKLVLIPAGEFLVGDDDMLRYGSPFRHTETIPGYWIYKDLVTVGMYKKFCKDTDRKMPPEPVFPAGNHFNPDWSKEDHPMVNITMDDAISYGKWAFGDDNNHLPSGKQFEKAARGRKGFKFPWGDTFDLTKVWGSKSVMGDCKGTCPVGKYGISPYGVSDMAGNTWQWCADLWDKTRCIVRGGSWTCVGEREFRPTFRLIPFPVGNIAYDVGFRCIAAL